MCTPLAKIAPVILGRMSRRRRRALPPAGCTSRWFDSSWLVVRGGIRGECGIDAICYVREETNKLGQDSFAQARLAAGGSQGARRVGAHSLRHRRRPVLKPMDIAPPVCCAPDKQDWRSSSVAAVNPLVAASYLVRHRTHHCVRRQGTPASWCRPRALKGTDMSGALPDVRWTQAWREELGWRGGEVRYAWFGPCDFMHILEGRMPAESPLCAHHRAHLMCQTPPIQALLRRGWELSG